MPFSPEKRKAYNKERYYNQSRTLNAFWIYDRDLFRCVYCGKSSIEDTVKLAVDHITARNNGGTEQAGNLVTSCESCNSAKRSRELSDEVQSRIRAAVSQRNAASGILDTTLIRMPKRDNRTSDTEGKPEPQPVLFLELNTS